MTNIVFRDLPICCRDCPRLGMVKWIKSGKKITPIHEPYGYGDGFYIWVRWINEGDTNPLGLRFFPSQFSSFDRPKFDAPYWLCIGRNKKGQRGRWSPDYNLHVFGLDDGIPHHCPSTLEMMVFNG